MKVIEFAFTCYPVKDMARARAFYEGIFGLKPAMVHGMENGAWTEYELGEGTFALGKAQGWEPSSDGASMAFEMDDFDDAVADLKARGVSFKVEPFTTPVCRMAFVLDPEGNTLCIHKRNPGHH
jgi:predicted enzyme related to lactoylglutathione lyase